MKRYRLIVILLSLLVLAPSSAKEFYGYTNERPLIIVCDWDFQPFEYLDSEGHPAGYNIEVLDLILNRLEIPHQFVMQEWKVASRYFENHEADLIHALAPEYRKLPYVQTKKYVNYYSLRAARRVDTPPIRDLHLLDSTDVIAVKANDYAELSVRDMGAVPYTVKYLSPKDGLAGVRAGHIPYYIWGEVPLRHKAQELNLDSIAFDKTSIPAGELHIVGYDKEIIDMIDDEYTRLEESGDLQTINDRWFHPERLSEETSPVALFIVVGLLVLIVIFVLLGRVMKLRVNAAVRRSAELNDIMTRALEMDDDYVLEYDLNSGWVRNVYGNLLPAGGMSIDEMAASTVTNQYKMTGTLVKADNALKKDDYYLNGSGALTQMAKPSANVNSAYAWIQYIGAANHAKGLTIGITDFDNTLLSDDETTGIQIALLEESGINTFGTDDNIYNLNGIKVGDGSSIQNLPKGIYVVKGKKVIIK